MKKKIAIMLVAVVLVIGCVVGGTLAWLTAETAPVTNTFTVGDINIKLEESKDLDLKMVPGKTITKDPKVTVVANSEACWLFVKIEKSTNFDSFMEFGVAEGWTPLDGVDGVYYRSVDAATAKAGEEYTVLANDQVLVQDKVTKGMLTAETFTAPTLTFTAYAVQKEAATTAAEAWVIAQESAN